MGPEPEPPDYRELTEGVSNLDTARLALRWALERIRALESAAKDAVELREQARAAKQCAELELDAARAAIAKSTSELSAKERFVAEMRQILTDQFKGEAAAKQSLDQRQRLEAELTAVREAAQRRLEDEQASARGVIDQLNRRLAEAELSFKAALDEAWRQHREDREAKETLERQFRVLEERRREEVETLRARNKQLEPATAAEEKRRADEAAERIKALLGVREEQLQALHEEGLKIREEARRESEDLNARFERRQREDAARLKAAQERLARETEAARAAGRETEERFAAEEKRRADEATEEKRRAGEEAERIRLLRESLTGELDALRAEGQRLREEALRRAQEASEDGQKTEERHRCELAEARRLERTVTEQESRRAAAAIETLKKAEDRMREELRALQDRHDKELERERSRVLAPAPSPAAAPPSFRWKRFPALAAFAACALAAGWHFFISGKDHLIPTAHPSALVWKDGLLWVSDWHAQTIYALREQRFGLKLARRHELPGSHIMGLALSGDRMFVLDSWAHEIQIRRLDEKLTVEAVAATPGPKPSALYFDGKYLWSVDRQQRRIFQHAIDDSLSVLNSYPVPHQPIALHSDAAGFWTVDSESLAFVRHYPPPNMSVEGYYRLRELVVDGRPVSAFTRRGGRLWVGRDGSNKLLERSMRRLTEWPRGNRG